MEEFKSAEGSIKKRKRRGRGNASGLGGEAGRGHKGQKSRSGYSRQAGFEGGQMPLYRRLPKRRGLGNNAQTYCYPINLSTLELKFESGEIVNIESLILKGIISKPVQIKLLANGELTKSLVIQAHSVSKSALEKIEKSKSKFEQIK